jgi:hypothetical protein
MALIPPSPSLPSASTRRRFMMVLFFSTVAQNLLR